MKKKIFTLLTLLVLCVTGAWADDVIFSMASVTALTGSDVTVSKTKYTVTTKKSASVTATFNSGSSAEVYNGKGSDAEMLDTSNKKINLGGSGGSYFHATFTTALAVGDVIKLGTATGTGYLAGTSTKPGSEISITEDGYTIPLGSGLVGKTDVYYWKPSSGEIKTFTEFTITRPTAAVPGDVTFSPATGAEVAAGSSITLSAENATGYKYKWTNSTATPSDGWSDGNTATVPAYGSENVYLHAYGTSAAGDGPASYAQYTITKQHVATPTFTVYGNKVVKITCATAGATIYYGGSDVKTGEKTEYTGQFIPANSGTIYAYATKTDALDSELGSQAVTLPNVGDVIGKKLMTLQPEATPDSDTPYGSNTFTKGGYSLASDKALNNSSMNGYPCNFKATVNDGTFTITPPSNVTIQSIKIYGTSNDNNKETAVTAGDGGTIISTPSSLMVRNILIGENVVMSEVVMTVDTPTEGNPVSFKLGASASQARFYVEVYGTTSATSTIINVAKEYTTFIPTYDLDFSSAAELTAYIATAATASTVTMTPVNKVPAGTPIVLKATSLNADIAVNVAASTDDVSANKLKIGDGATSIGGSGKYDYVLSNGVFYHASAGVLPAGKCYLHLDAEPAANELTMDFGDGDVTGIKNLTPALSKGEGAVYDLQGRQVAQPTKGLYIVNGKKVFVP